MAETAKEVILRNRQLEEVFPVTGSEQVIRPDGRSVENALKDCEGASKVMIKSTPQKLTDDAQLQARTNIGAFNGFFERLDFKLDYPTSKNINGIYFEDGSPYTYVTTYDTYWNDYIYIFDKNHNRLSRVGIYGMAFCSLPYYQYSNKPFIIVRNSLYYCTRESLTIKRCNLDGTGGVDFLIVKDSLVQ